MKTPRLPDDHNERLERALLSLDGLSIGDAFCSQFFLGPVWERHFAARTAPPGPWRWTDDTAMAVGIVEVLMRYGSIDQDDLARTFAAHYQEDAYRGYGPAAHGLLQAIWDGQPWRDVSHAVFNGTGSMGNGSAMRVSVVGAYFADDVERAVREAAASAEVTHAHPEGEAGAVAVAAAAALAWQWRERAPKPGDLIRAVLEHTPPGQVADGLHTALALVDEDSVERAARILGNGSRVTCPDTVPFVVWVADRHLGDFVAGLWTVIEAGGDVDTTGAMVGGVVALHAPRTIPPTWLESREPVAPASGRPDVG